MSTTPWPHRQRILRALGVVPCVLRERADAAHAVAPADVVSPVADAATGAARCVLVLPAGCPHRADAILERAAASFGPLCRPLARVEVADDQPAGPVPEAAVYLAFGEAQAHALGRALPAAVMAQADVVLLDLPQTLLQAGGKRRLWQALGRLRRQRRDATGG